MANKKTKINSNRRCKDYEMFADDYFKSIFSKKSSLGHSRYVQQNDSDSCSKSKNNDDSDYCNCNNTVIINDTSELNGTFHNSDLTMKDNMCSIKKGSHEGKKCYIDEDSLCDSYEESYYKKATHKNTSNDSSYNCSYDYENIDDENKNRPNKCKNNFYSCKEETNACNKDAIYSYPHNHEITGSVNFTGSNNKRHNHRTCGLTSDAIICENSHVHNVYLYTDTTCRHIHEILTTTSKAIYLPSGKHFHIIKGYTKTSDGHVHEYYFLTLNNDPSLI